MIEIPVSIFSEWYIHLPKCGREIIQSNGSIKEEQIKVQTSPPPNFFVDRISI